MSDILVSIIVPIYNVEAYLERCIKSICSQSYKNIEIILVDDGSPDNCPKMCDDYAQLDDRIIVIHKENGGLSDARNVGLMKSTGEFILYVDSDDFIENNLVENLVDLINKYNADIAVSTFTFSTGEVSDCLRRSGKVFVGDSSEMLILASENGLWQAWAKLIRRDIALKCTFIKNLIYEDYENTPRLFLSAKKIVISMDGKYRYTIREDSIMGARKLKLNTDFVDITEKNLSLYEKSSLDIEKQNRLYKFLFKQLVYNYNNILKMNSKSINQEFVDKTIKILQKHKKKWSNNNQVEYSVRFAYSILSYCPSWYNVLYRLKKK